MKLWDLSIKTNQDLFSVYVHYYYILNYSRPEFCPYILESEINNTARHGTLHTCDGVGGKGVD